MKIGFAQPHKKSRVKEHEQTGAKKGWYNQLEQFIKFAFVGISNTVVFWGIATFVTYLFYGKLEKSYMIGNVAAFLVSVAWSFFWNRKLVFHDKSRGWKLVIALYKSYITYAFTGILLNNILSWIWIEWMGLTYTITPLLNSAIGFPINYILNKKWTFSREGMQ